MKEVFKSIPIARTSLTVEEINSVLEPLNSGWLVQGPKVKAFEEKWTNFTKSKYSLAVTSCTSGMHLAVAALGLGPGDEVIVPAFTWISTANVVEHQGATPIFCDIDLETFNIDVQKIEALITEKTVGIMPVHLFGLSADMNPIMDLARQYNLWVLEDAACGFGATYDGVHVGNFGTAGVFSFHPRKAITTGEGGMVTVSDAELANKIQQLRDHGAVKSDLQRHFGPKPYLLADHIHAGYNQRMTDLQGSLGEKQMDRAGAIVLERRRLAERYDEAFKSLDFLRTPYINRRYGHGYQSYACVLDMPGSIDEVNHNRNQWMEILQGKGISTRPAPMQCICLLITVKNMNLKPKTFLMLIEQITVLFLCHCFMA